MTTIFVTCTQKRQNSFFDAYAKIAPDIEIVAGLLDTEDVSNNDNSAGVEDKAVEFPNINELLQVIGTF